MTSSQSVTPSFDPVNTLPFLVGVGFIRAIALLLIVRFTGWTTIPVPIPSRSDGRVATVFNPITTRPTSQALKLVDEAPVTALMPAALVVGFIVAQTFIASRAAALVIFFKAE